MGIPGFISRMVAAGYAESCKEIGRRGDRGHTYAIMDGPAYAYFLHRSSEQTSGQKGDGRIGSPVSYADLALAAVQWLEVLVDRGFVM